MDMKQNNVLESIMSKKIIDKSNIEKFIAKESNRAFVKNKQELSFVIEKLNDKYQYEDGTAYRAVHLIVNAVVQLFVQKHDFKSESIRNLGVDIFRSFLNIKGPFRVVFFDDFIYPSCERNLEKVMKRTTFEHIQKLAEKKLKEVKKMDPEVREHMQKIVLGVAPFGYIVRD